MVQILGSSITWTYPDIDDIDTLLQDDFLLKTVLVKFDQLSDLKYIRSFHCKIQLFFHSRVHTHTQLHPSSQLSKNPTAFIGSKTAQLDEFTICWFHYCCLCWVPADFTQLSKLVHVQHKLYLIETLKTRQTSVLHISESSIHSLTAEGKHAAGHCLDK